MSDSRVHWLQRILFFLSLLAAWEIVFRFGGWPEYLFPGPLQVASGLWESFLSGLLLQDVLVSLRRIIIAFSIAVVCGVMIGLLITESPTVGGLLQPFVAGFQSLPSICWFPLALLWLGLSEYSVYVVTILGALFAMSTAVSSGSRQIPPGYLDASATLGARGFDRYRWVIFPALMPALVSGMRQGWSFAWRSLMAAELLFHNGGVGFSLMRARELNDVSQVMGVIVVILILGATVESLVFARAEKKLRSAWGLMGQRV